MWRISTSIFLRKGFVSSATLRQKDLQSCNDAGSFYWGLRPGTWTTMRQSRQVQWVEGAGQLFVPSLASAQQGLGAFWQQSCLRWCWSWELESASFACKHRRSFVQLGWGYPALYHVCQLREWSLLRAKTVKTSGLDSPLFALCTVTPLVKHTKRILTAKLRAHFPIAWRYLQREFLKHTLDQPCLSTLSNLQHTHTHIFTELISG